MQVLPYGTFNNDQLVEEWKPFFSQFSTEPTLDEKKKILHGIIEQGARMIAKALERQKKALKAMH